MREKTRLYGFGEVLGATRESRKFASRASDENHPGRPLHRRVRRALKRSRRQAVERFERDQDGS